YSRSTFYSLPVSILSAPARALFYLGRTGRFSVAEPTVGQRRRLITSLPSFDSPTIAAQESGTYWGTRQSRWLRTADCFAVCATCLCFLTWTLLLGSRALGYGTSLIRGVAPQMRGRAGQPIQR